MPTKGFDFDAVVIGAGVVGLAAAARLASPNRSVLVVERHDGICRETSSRHSEVIHAGIYYPRGSLKARSCVEGRELLYRRCEALGIPALRAGKYIVALEDDELAGLEDLWNRGQANGVSDLEILDRRALARRDHQSGGIAALWSPSTGVGDSHQVAASLEAEAESKGAAIVFQTEVVDVERLETGYRLITREAQAPEAAESFGITSRLVINASGLAQDHISELAGIDVDAAGYRQYPCKGCYFSIAPRHRGRVEHLIYPDVGGGMRIGPDATYVDGPPFDLSVPPDKASSFLAAGQRLMPWLEEGDLEPELAGIRPKLKGPGGEFRDFVVAEESARGLPGWVTLAGIESPGFTASLALAEEAFRCLEDSSAL